jgi:hypothetical protein
MGRLGQGTRPNIWPLGVNLQFITNQPTFRTLNCHTTDFLGIGNWELGIGNEPPMRKYEKYPKLLSPLFKFPENRLCQLRVRNVRSTGHDMTLSSNAL